MSDRTQLDDTDRNIETPTELPPWVQEWKRGHLIPDHWADEILAAIEQAKLEERRRVGRELVASIRDNWPVLSIGSGDYAIKRVRRICQLPEEE